MTPQTDFVLVRGPRTDNNNNSIQVMVSIQKNTFDLTDYSFLRMNPATKTSMEEWVPTKELELYQQAFKVTE